MALQYAILGACRLNNTRLNYNSGRVLLQVGRRLLPARLGLCRLNAFRLAYDDTVDALRCVDPDSFQLEQSAGELPTLSVTIKDDISRRPTAGDPVFVGVGTLGNPIFRGHLQTVSEPEKHGWFSYSCQAESIESELTWPKIFATYTNSYAGEILQLLLAAHAPRFIWNPWNERGCFYDSITFNGESLYNIALQLASDCGVVFSVSLDYRVNFAAGTITEAFEISDNVTEVGNLTINSDATELFNEVIVRYTETQSVSQSFKGDGERKEFNLAMPIHSVVSITKNGTALTWGLRNKEDNSANGVSVDLDSGVVYTVPETAYTSSDVLRVQYIGRVNARATFTDSAAVLEWGGISGTNGKRTKVEDRRDLLGYVAAKDYALTLLSRYSGIYADASYNIRRRTTTPPNVAIGQMQHITARQHDLTLTVQSISISIWIPRPNSQGGFEYAVKLGERTYAIEDDLKDVKQKTQAEYDQFVYTEEV